MHIGSYNKLQVRVFFPELKESKSIVLVALTTFEQTRKLNQSAIKEPQHKLNLSRSTF